MRKVAANHEARTELKRPAEGSFASFPCDSPERPPSIAPAGPMTTFRPGLCSCGDGIGEGLSRLTSSIYQPRLSPRPVGHPATLISAAVSKESLPDQGSGAQPVEEGKMDIAA
jgi:hypothetical protein